MIRPFFFSFANLTKTNPNHPPRDINIMILSATICQKSSWSVIDLSIQIGNNWRFWMIPNWSYIQEGHIDSFRNSIESLRIFTHYNEASLIGCRSKTFKLGSFLLLQFHILFFISDRQMKSTNSDDCTLVKNNLWQHSVATPYFTLLSNLISLKISTFQEEFYFWDLGPAEFTFFSIWTWTL